MRNIPLDAVPNQQLIVTLDSNRWELTIKEARGVMCVDVMLNDEVLILGQRIVAGTPLLPYRYLQGSGNFVLLTDADELPYWTRFGIDQQLVYASAGEIANA